MMQGAATVNQTNFIKKLISERAIEVTFDEATISKADASKLIGQLLAIKPSPQVKAAVAPEAKKVTQDGMYKTPDGTIYKVQFNRAQGDGRRCYAKRLVVAVEPIRDAEGHIEVAAVVQFEYAAGAIARLQPEWRMTIEDAKAFGALYGTCVRCGRTLTREESIERSMGPVCAKAFA